MVKQPIAPVANPSADVGELLAHLMGDTGGIVTSMGGYRIKVYHSRAFPWDEVFKELLYRDFRVHLTRHKADIYIEAHP